MSWIPPAKPDRSLNDLQRLASTENYALFQLASMKSNLIHLKRCDSIHRNAIYSLEHLIDLTVHDIKTAQRIRKEARERKEKK